MSKSSTTTEKLDPVHPGEVLMEDFIKGFGITQNRLAVAIGVPPRRINEIVHGKRSITADTALRLARYLGTSAQFWLNLQDQYNLDIEEDQIQAELDAIQPLKNAQGWEWAGGQATA
jgi:addiction module HigA family antidote